jgi:predicted secreted hydrolase
MSATLGQTSEGYQAVIPGKTMTFPLDHGAHPGFRQEWWYLTANLTTEAGEPIGLQWTQFRFAGAMDGIVSAAANGWATNQLYMAHTALTTARIHLADEKWSRQHPQMAYVLDAPLTVYLDNWRWQSLGGALFPALLQARADGFSYRLSLSSFSPLQLQGEGGYSRKSADGSVASYYYSQPFIEVRGEVVIEGKPVKVSGNAWLDREWSSQFLNDGQQGWDWFALRLNDGSALMLFQLRASEPGEKPFFSGRRMYPDGSGKTLRSEQITLEAIRFETVEGSNYPVTWEIRVPDEQVDITLKPLNPLARMPLTVSYWEGPVHFTGSHSGVGYMELTGY